MIGGRYFSDNVRMLNDDGRLVIIGLMGGAKAKEAALAQIMMRRLTITGSTLRAQSDAVKASIAKELANTVWPLLLPRGDRGGDGGGGGGGRGGGGGGGGGGSRPLIDVIVDSVFPLDGAADAHAYMESSAHVGKIILGVNEGL